MLQLLVASHGLVRGLRTGDSGEIEDIPSHDALRIHEGAEPGGNYGKENRHVRGGIP
jgi:hypothetical protein